MTRQKAAIDELSTIRPPSAHYSYGEGLDRGYEGEETDARSLSPGAFHREGWKGEGACNLSLWPGTSSPKPRAFRISPVTFEPIAFGL